MGTVLLFDGHGRDGPVEGGGRGGGHASGVGGPLGAFATATSLGGGGHAGVEGGELLHHALVLLLLVGVDGLCMLAEVVEAGELLAAVAGEGALAGVLSVTCVGGGERRGVGRRGRGDKKGRGAGGGGEHVKQGRAETYLMCLARCSLLLKTILHSP